MSIDHPLRSTTLDNGDDVIIRRSRPEDVAAVTALYERLSIEDKRRRFFSATCCFETVAAGWLDQQDTGGVVLVAEVRSDGNPPQVVGEAGYALEPDGDGELAITVDEPWRGWLGAWLIDALYDEAAANGVPNLHAQVKVKNKPMLGLLRRRGHMYSEHTDWSEIRLVVSTTGDTPGWAPTHDRPRLAVEARGGRWAGEAAARAAGFDVRTCPGPSGRRPGCPALEGKPCALVDGADAVVMALDPDDPDTAAIAEAHRAADETKPVVVLNPASGAVDVEEIIALVRRSVVE